MSNFKIALAGNPNVGKSTIFNTLTGQRQHTGNWPGKTVCNAVGKYKYRENNYEIYDLPGTYSLISHSKEELVARDLLCFNQDIDCTVVVCNAVSLERGLNLVLQILEMTSNVIVVVNLLDEADKRNINIDLSKLEEILGVPVIGCSATKNIGIEDLKEKVEEISKNPNRWSYKIKYNQKITEEVERVSGYIDCFSNKEWLALRLIAGDKEIVNSFIDNLGIDITLNKELMNMIKKSQENLKEIDITLSIVSDIIENCHSIYNEVVTTRINKRLEREKMFDKILTSKRFGIPIMILMLFFVFWLTIVGSNYPSELLSNFLFSLEDDLYNLCSFMPDFLRNILVYGMYKTTAWVVGVMLPPMMIFFPLFTIMEDIGLLPRIAFNMDSMFSKCTACGKQCLTMCMGVGCNAVGVTGARIIDSKRERLLAIITNSFMPCNGRYPVIISVISMFIIGTSRKFCSSILVAFILVLVILLSIVMTFLTCKFLSKYLLKGEKVSFILELPDYRKINYGKVIITSIFDRTIFVLGRAVAVAMPTGIFIYLLTNISIDGVSILNTLANFLDPFSKLIGLDGVILLSYFLGMPANEIVLPIILMTYLGTNSLTDYDSLTSLKTILVDNGWTQLTAVCFIIFNLFHFPCSTTLLTIKKETESWFYTFLSFIIPLIIGLVLCFGVSSVVRIISFIL